MKKIFLLLFFTNLFYRADAQLTYIPDDAFEVYLESNFPNCATGGIDDFVIGYEVIGTISLINLPIQSLNGIENLNYLHSIFIINCTYLNFIDLSNVNVNNINITNVNSLGLNDQGMSISIANCPNVTNIKMPQGYINCIEVTGNLYLLNSVEFQSTNILKPGLPCFGIIILKNLAAPNWDFIDLSMIQVELGCSGFDIEDDFRCVLLDNNGYLNWYGLSCYDSNEVNGLTCVQIENPGYAENAWPSYNDFTYSQQCNSCTSGNDNREVNGVISLYPNPTSSEITITSDKFTNEPYTLFDQMGRTVGSGILAGTNTTISLSTLTKGIYILKVEGDYESAIVVKE
jgi:Secretion system C-terminal sorting domain